MMDYDEVASTFEELARFREKLHREPGFIVLRLAKVAGASVDPPG